MKRTLVFLIIGFLSVSAYCSNLLFNENFASLDEKELPLRWMLSNYKTQSSFLVVKNAIQGKNALCINLPDYKDQALIKQPLGKTIPQGTLVKLSCYYKMENYETKSPNAAFFSLTYGDKAENSKNNRLYLNASPEWLYAEKIFISSQKCSPSASFFIGHSKGKIYVTDLNVEILPQSGEFKDNFIYTLKEAEDLEQEPGIEPRVSKWNPDGTIVYSGQGAIGEYKKAIKWKFQAKEELDEQTLAKDTTYHIWLRLYGYLEEPLITVKLDTASRIQNIEVIKTEANEKKDSLGKYAGPGNFYWQYAGSVTVRGNVHELQIEPDGRICLDALFLTSDISYKPEKLDFTGKIPEKTPMLIDIKSDEKVLLLGEYKIFGITDSFPVPLNLRIYPQKGFKDIREIDSPAYVYLALPPCIEITGFTSHWAGKDWKTSSSAGNMDLKKEGEKKIEGVNYNLYSISVYRLYSFIQVFIKCAEGKLEDGKKTSVYFWLKDGTLETNPQKMTLEMVSLSPAKKMLKNIFIGPMGGHMRSFFRDYHELPDILVFCGMNIVNTWGASSIYKENVEINKEFIKKCNGKGIAVIDEISPFGSQYKPSPALTIEGKSHKYSPALYQDKDSPAIKLMCEDIENIVKSGISGLTLDDEAFNHAGDDLDFSKETKDLFKSYLNEKHPDLKYMDPSDIVKNKKQHEKLYSAWVDFKCDRIISWYEIYRKTYEKVLKETNANSTFGKKYFVPVIVNTAPFDEYKKRLYFDIRKLAKCSTHISPMIYTYHGIKNAGNVGKGIKNLKSFTGLKENIIAPTLLGGHENFGEISYSEMKMIKYEIYECLINQSPGMFFWVSTGFMNPLVLRQVITAINTTVEYEDFFTKGIPENITIEPAALCVDALRLDKKIIVYVSNYDLADNIMADVKIKGMINKVTDMETGKSMVFSENSFSVDFSKERGRIFLVELK